MIIFTLFSIAYHKCQVIFSYETIIYNKLLSTMSSKICAYLFRVANVRHSHVILTIRNTHILSQ